MKIQFKNAEGVVFFVDTETLYWAMLDGPASDDTTQVIESGDLTNLNYGRFALAPRTEKDGLATIAVMPLIHGTKVIIAFSANVATKDFFMTEPVTEVTYEIVSERVPDSTGLAGKDGADVESTTGLAGIGLVDPDLVGRTEDAGLVTADRDGAPELVGGSSITETSEASAAS